MNEAAPEPTLVRKREHLSRPPLLGDGPVEPSGSLIGLKLGEYDVIAQLGAGGMGIVYRGLQSQIGKSVAIKVLKPEIAAGTDSVQALLAEARAVNSIHHPGIVDIFSFGSTPDGRPYVVMELLEGESLDEVLRRVVRFQPLEAIELLEQMLSALDAAHAAGVIHRDLKPANIHLTQLKDGKWRVKLLDFGLAKLTAPGASSAAQTNANVVRGTPEYMSPEQARAQNVSARTDLYAIGVVAYELLTGSLPFKADNPIELLMQHISKPPPAPTSLEPTIPAEFETLILQLLEKDPEARPASALEVRRELLKLKKQLIEGGTQIRRRPTAPVSQVSQVSQVPQVPQVVESARPVPSSSTPKLIAGLVVVVLLLIGALVLLQRPVTVVDPHAEVVDVPTAPVAEPVEKPLVAPPVAVEPVAAQPPIEKTIEKPIEKPIEAAVEKPTAKPPEPVAVKPRDPPRPKAKLHTAEDVKKLLSTLAAEASKRPPGEARSRKRALDEFRDELNAGGKPEDLWQQLKAYERDSQ
jgi:serine/threonine protein kinase